MKLDDMIRVLTELREANGGDCEVRMMTQRSWPFECDVHGIATSDAIAACGGDHGRDPDPDHDEDADPIVFIVEGDQVKYGNRLAWEACEPQ